jgi:GABA(A) receptor-associated protein
MDNIKISYKNNHTIEERKSETLKIKNKYSDKIPVIVTKDHLSQLNNITKEKYLVPFNMTIGQFMSVIREKTSIGQEQAINIFLIDYNNNNILASTSASFESLYVQYVEKEINHKNYDGYIYLIYTGENVFG